MARIGGSRRKKSGIFTKTHKQKGKISHREFLKQLNVGDKVALKLEPAVQSATYLPRFHGKIGTVIGKEGTCYQVEIRDGNKQKLIVTHPIHLKLIK